VHGDFGATFQNDRSVSSIIAERFPVTLKLALGAFGVEVVLGLTLALVAAAKQRRLTDHVILGATLVLLTVPIIVIGFALQYVFGVKLKVLPVAGIHDGWKSYVLPSIALGLGSAAALGRLARSSILDNTAGEHIRAAVARGVPRRRVTVRHVLKNSLVPIVTIMGLDFAYLMGGAVFTETIFNLPGLGNAIFFGIQTENGPLVVGLVVLSAIIFIFTNLFVDLLCARIDPRITYE
jgi:peptide/nickel transport system permease protein/oligopeptide transport system permease protein